MLPYLIGVTYCTGQSLSSEAMSQLVKKTLNLRNTKVIIGLSFSRHLYLFWDRLTQPMPFNPLPENTFQYYPLTEAWSSKLSICLRFPTDIWWWILITNLLTMWFAPFPSYLVPFKTKCCPLHPVHKHPQLTLLPQRWTTKFHTHTDNGQLYSS